MAKSKRAPSPKSPAKPPLKIGFDLDGVILYNPARLMRPFVHLFKKTFLKKRLKKFYIPKSPWEKLLWRWFHKSSIFVAPGLNDIRKLAKEGKIEPYIVTARFAYLKDDLEEWIRKIDGRSYFRDIIYNELDEQPHLFKEKTINRLKLDAFVEDNWDIVSYLSERHQHLKVFWIYNIFDSGIKYADRFPGLDKVVAHLKNSFK